LVSTVGDNKLNEARVQYAYEDRPRPYSGPNVNGTNRPFPDIAFDFGRGYRFGMPFFIPVIYDDTRWQFLDNFTVLTGDHTIKAGVEYNKTEAFQTFIGFANGLYKFLSTDGFLNFANNPSYVECSDGSSSQDGTCPAGTDITGPVDLFLQQAGVGDVTVEEAGTQTIDADEYAVFIQDLWQPRPNLTFSFGLRWEGQDNPSVITPPSEVFFADFIGETVNGQEFPSDGDIPDDMEMWQPRLGFSWDPKGNGKTVIRANAGRYNARVPGLYLASTRSTNGSRGQTVFRNSATSGFLGPVPPIWELLDVSDVGVPFQPNVYVFDKDYENPDTDAFAFAVEHEVASGLAALLKYNYAETEHLIRMYNSNDPLLGSNWSSGLGADGSNGINELWTVQSSASSKYWGITAGLKGRIGTRVNLNAFYTYSKDKSDDDNERDPFLFRYARITELDKEWSYSDRDQRHRFNAWLLWTAPYGINVNLTYAYRSAQPQSITETGAPAASPGDRINADGTVTRRNLGKKDNKYSALDVRLSKLFNLGSVQLEAIGEVFNVFNQANFRTPQVTNLVYNFDGTIRSGVGDPRQFQVGLRLIW
jgi:outer membrane receptor protein involved in Fe transport